MANVKRARDYHRIGDGPWSIGEKSPDLHDATYCIRDADGWDMAHHFGVGPNAEKVAKLIAAAPELRDALRDILDIREMLRLAEGIAPGRVLYIDMLYRRARAALAKAGE